MLKNSKSPFPNHTKIYTGKPFAFYNTLEIKLTKRKKSIQNKENCVSLLRKSKREYYCCLDVKNITVNKSFWKTSTQKS